MALRSQLAAPPPALAQGGPIAPVDPARIARQALACPLHSHAEIGALYGVTAADVTAAVDSYIAALEARV